MARDTFLDDPPRKRRRTTGKEHRPRRKGFRGFALLVLLVSGVALLPTIVAKTPLRNIALAWLMPSEALRATIGDASLGWFSAPALSDIQVRDAAGQPLLSAETVRVERSTWALATNPRDLGTIEILRPTVYLTVRPDGSNWEDVAAELLTDLDIEEAATDDTPQPSQPVAVSVRLVEAAILAEDTMTGRRWRVEGVNLEFHSPSDAAQLGRLTASGRIISDADTPGQFAVALEPLGNGRQQLKLQASAVPMVLADPLLRRFVTGVEIHGLLSGAGTATWSGGSPSFPDDLATSGTLRIERLDATAPVLAGDRVRLAQVELPWSLSARPGGLAIDTLQMRTDLGHVAVRGMVDTATQASLLDATARHDLEARGSLDLARLAAMLPHALRIRADTTITSGTLDVDARCHWVDNGQTLTGSVRTAGLAATAAGRPIRWDEPASANFALRREPNMLRLDSLVFRSDFLQIDANGTPQQLAARAQFDLQRLSSQLGQFVDLTGTELDGQGEMTADVRTEGSVVDVSDAKLLVTKLRAAGGGWSIDEPRVELSGNARWDGATGRLTADAAQLVTSTLAVAAKDIRFEAGRRGIAQLNGLAAYRVDLARLAAWQHAANQPAPYRPQGMLTGNLRLDQQSDRVLCQLSTQGQNVVLAEWRPASGVQSAGYRTIWQEPQLDVTGRATYERSADRLTLDQLHAESTTLQATLGGRIENVTTTADANVTGTLNYDLAQITPFLHPFVGDGIKLTGRETAQIALNGRLKQSSESSENSAISWSRRIQARAEAPWTSANVYGLPVGPGKITAALGDGQVIFDPLSLAVAEGRLNLSPKIRLDPEPAELSNPAAPVLTDMRITPEVSEAMLKYFAPVLAGVTQSEGLFSMQLEGLRVPLSNPRGTDAAGQLTVHSVRVAPGPLAREWIELAQQIEAIAKKRDPLALAQRQPATLLSIEDQTVNFRVVDGRVYHQNMELRVGDVVLHSQGSVGLDETLALRLTVPIQDRWVEGEKLLVGLKGQSLEIPITGTLRSPRMDQRAVADLSSRLIQSAAQQTIGNEVNKALDKLFKSR